MKIPSHLCIHLLWNVGWLLLNCRLLITLIGYMFNACLRGFFDKDRVLNSIDFITERTYMWTLLDQSLCLVSDLHSCLVDFWNIVVFSWLFVRYVFWILVLIKRQPRWCITKLLELLEWHEVLQSVFEKTKFLEQVDQVKLLFKLEACLNKVLILSTSFQASWSFAKLGQDVLQVLFQCVLSAWQQLIFILIVYSLIC